MLDGADGAVAKPLRCYPIQPAGTTVAPWRGPGASPGIGALAPSPRLGVPRAPLAPPDAPVLPCPGLTAPALGVLGPDRRRRAAVPSGHKEIPKPQFSPTGLRPCPAQPDRAFTWSPCPRLTPAEQPGVGSSPGLSGLVPLSPAPSQLGGLECPPAKSHLSRLTCAGQRR